MEEKKLKSFEDYARSRGYANISDLFKDGEKREVNM
jgi:hypothetical protein